MPGQVGGGCSLSELVLEPLVAGEDGAADDERCVDPSRANQGQRLECDVGALARGESADEDQVKWVTWLPCARGTRIEGTAIPL